MRKDHCKLKFYHILLAFFFIIGYACKDLEREPPIPEIPITDLSKYKMKILPDVPTSSVDVKLVIYEDCKYNKLNKVQRNGSTIDIEKQFNSMIMAPCMLTNDTILIGKLPVGTYGVKFRLIDIAKQPDVNITFSISFKLLITK